MSVGFRSSLFARKNTNGIFGASNQWNVCYGALILRFGVMVCHVILVGECALIVIRLSVLCFSWLYCVPTYIRLT